MDRRRLLLAVGGSLVTVAGCSTEPADSTATPEPQSTDTQTPTDTATRTAQLTADEALAIESSNPVEGTMVVPGVSGTARNAAARTLVDCVVEATAEVNGVSHSGQTRRDSLDPDATWEWEVSFEDADTGSVENIEITGRATYSG